MPDRRKKRSLPAQPQYAEPLVPYTPYPPMIPFNDPPRASIQILRDKNATVVNVAVSHVTDFQKGPDYVFESSGSTKREQGDRYDQQAGDLLAIGRALRNAGDDMIREGNKRVSQIVEEQAEERRRAAERRENKAEPTRHRTLKEWEKIQHEQQQRERNAQLARNLGLELEEVAEDDALYAYGSRTKPVSSSASRFAVKGNRFLEIEEDRVVIRDAAGEVVTMIERA